MQPLADAPKCLKPMAFSPLAACLDLFRLIISCNNSPSALLPSLFGWPLGLRLEMKAMATRQARQLLSGHEIRDANHTGRLILRLFRSDPSKEMPSGIEIVGPRSHKGLKRSFATFLATPRLSADGVALVWRHPALIFMHFAMFYLSSTYLRPH